MSPRILSKRFREIGADVRLGLRLSLVRWRRLDRVTRSRIEMGAVFSLLPLSAAIAALAAAPAALDLDSMQSQPIVETVQTPSVAAQVDEITRRSESFLREARVQRGESVGALLARMGVEDADAVQFVRVDAQARPLVRLPQGRLVQANIDAEGRLNWLRAFAGGDEGPTAAMSRVVTLGRNSDGALTVTESSAALERRVELCGGEI
jgi:cell envelope opacity-associated protein A